MGCSVSKAREERQLTNGKTHGEYLKGVLRRVEAFQSLGDLELQMAMELLAPARYQEGDVLVRRGTLGSQMFIVVSGKLVSEVQPNRKDRGLTVYLKSKQLSRLSIRLSPGKVYYNAGDCFGDRYLFRRETWQATVTAVTDVNVLALTDANYHQIIADRDFREETLRNVKLLEMLSEDQIAKVAGALQRRVFEAGEKLCSQGDTAGLEMFIVESGECVATVRTATEEQEVKRYNHGELFGELALLKNSPRGATITASSKTAVFVLRRNDLERLLGPLSQLRAEQYLADPRKLIADFYSPGDTRGPKGSLELKSLVPDPTRPTSWFAVYRPTSSESIAKMLGRVGVGKGLNVKGKSAKRNRLSGFVPFIQISDNAHKSAIEKPEGGARVQIFYCCARHRDEVQMKLDEIAQQQVAAAEAAAHRTSDASQASEKVIQTQASADSKAPKHQMHPKASDASQASRPQRNQSSADFFLRPIDDYCPHKFGLDMPEAAVHELYIKGADLSPLVGWETGRGSEPAFMDMNLHAVREKSDPAVVIYQSDQTNPFNPLGLLVAYAEKTVKPVVSDFDTFLVGSKGMSYEPLPAKQVELMLWSLQHTENILCHPEAKTWTSRWLEVLKQEASRGFHPAPPKYGYGDPTSYKLICDIIDVTCPCGAIRHGAESFNFYFPQELDDKYLIVWSGFADTPWEYKTEPQLREFLLERARDGYAFPLHPVWPVRDQGWYEVLEALRDHGAELSAWFPPESHVMERIDDVHARFPKGLSASRSLSDVTKSIDLDVEGCEFLDLATMEVKKVVRARWDRIRDCVIRYAMKQRIEHLKENAIFVMSEEASEKAPREEEKGIHYIRSSSALQSASRLRAASNSSDFQIPCQHFNSKDSIDIAKDRFSQIETQRSKESVSAAIPYLVVAQSDNEALLNVKALPVVPPKNGFAHDDEDEVASRVEIMEHQQDAAGRSRNRTCFQFCCAEKVVTNL